jgi:hypothetical protein
VDAAIALRVVVESVHQYILCALSYKVRAAHVSAVRRLLLRHRQQRAVDAEIANRVSVEAVRT